MYQNCLDRVKTWLAILTEGPRKRRQLQWEFTAKATRKLLDQDAQLKRLLSWQAYCEHHGLECPPLKTSDQWLAENGLLMPNELWVTAGGAGGGCSSPPGVGCGVIRGPGIEFGRDEAGSFVRLQGSGKSLRHELSDDGELRVFWDETECAEGCVVTGGGSSGGSNRPKEWDFTGPCPWLGAWEEGEE